MPKLPVDQRLLEYLASRKIHISPERLMRLKWITFPHDLKIEPYSANYGGGYIPNMGAFSYSNSEIPHGVTLGRYCSIARLFSVQGFQHPVYAISTSNWTYSRKPLHIREYLADRGEVPKTFAPAIQKPPPLIGNDVWVGQNVTLANGITIGDGSVIAQNSHVTRSVPPYAVVGGNPAKIIRMRFAEPLIEKLMRLQWWNYDFLQFSGLDIADPERFANGLEERIGSLTPFTPEPMTAQDLITLFGETGA